MNNLFQNKKLLIAAGVSVGVIILAIIIFIAIGVKDKKAQKQRVSVIEFDNTTQTTTEPSTEPENKVENKVVDSRPTNEEILEDVEEGYKDTLLSFITALLDEDEMKNFLNTYFDKTAYVAYESVDQNDEEMFNVYNDVSEDDAQEIEDKLLEIPGKLSEIQTTKQGLSDLSTSLDNTTEAPAEEVDVRITEVSEIERYNEDDDKFSRAYITVDFFGTEKNLIITFFKNEVDDETTYVVIYITDDEGNSLFDIVDEIE